MSDLKITDKKIHVRPKKGRQVRKENGQIIPESGFEVVLNQYYRRRIKDGDLEIIKKTISKKAAPAKKATKTSKGTK